MKKTATKTRRGPRVLSAQALDRRVKLADLSDTTLSEITGGAGGGPPKAMLVADPGIDTW